MHVIEIIPISRGVSTDSLSYFTSKSVPIGAIVEVPLRNKMVQGIVIASNPAHQMKGEIKSAGFALKKIEKIKSTEFFSEPFVGMVKDMAQYYATTQGAIFDILAPRYILEQISKLKIPKEKDAVVKTDAICEKYAVQGDPEERYGAWKSLIRQEFAHKKSIFFLFPTIEDVEYAFERLGKGIEGYTFLLHGSLTPKKISDTWNAIMKEEHPVIIVSTGGFFSLPRTDIGSIVLEMESSRSYKILRRPFLDIRKVAESVAEKRGVKIFFADTLLRLETLWRESEGEIVQSSPFKFRSISTASDTLIDMKRDKTSGFEVLSKEVQELIFETKENSKHMIILAARRGISPTTVCGDCQTIVVCNNCATPVVLHKNESKSFFMCHRCGERRSAEEYCKKCGSWKLGSLGIGIDLVVEKIKEKFPDISLFKIDSDSAKGKQTPRSIVEKFRAQPGSILVGTEMMLPYIHDNIENSAIISLDSLFALPDFRIQERILYLLIHMRTLTSEHFMVQTRKAEEKVFEYGLKGNMHDFYKSTLEEREKFKYPPFTTLVKITLEGKKDEIVKEMEEIQSNLEPFEVEVFPAFTQTIKGKFVLHGLLRLSAEKWPHEDLVMKLRSLPPSASIKVDPETLL